MSDSGVALRPIISYTLVAYEHEGVPGDETVDTLLRVHACYDGAECLKPICGLVKREIKIAVK
ncbi:hypothetical protein J6590_022386 [Homalodisca vitripennis]|nr:hypothetical protein J6590_022386 [Homalodisca vitripennis]